MTSTIGIPIKLLNEATVSVHPQAPHAGPALTKRSLADGIRSRDTRSRLRLTPDRRIVESSSKVRMAEERRRNAPKQHRIKGLMTLISGAAEDNMNCQLENINVTQRDGRVTHLDRVYIRGSHVRLFIVPDMLR